MDRISKYSKGESSSNAQQQGVNFTLPKPESFDFHFQPEVIYSTQYGENFASSSRSNVRSFLTEMGFPPSLVDKVIEQNGEENVDLLLEILTEQSDNQKSKPQSSDSLENLFDDKDEDCPQYPTFVEPKEEPDVFDSVGDDKRTSLLKMNFSKTEIEFAMDKLGKNAQVDEIVDFITAAQIAENFNREADNNMTNDVTEINQDDDDDDDDENLYGTMEKTIKLLGMGFTENEVSLAIERFGSEPPVEELANAICANQVGEVYIIKKEKLDDFRKIHSGVATSSRSVNVGVDSNPRSVNVGVNINPGNHAWGAAKLRARDIASLSRNRTSEDTHIGKKPKQEDDEDFTVTSFMSYGFEDYSGDLGSYSEPMWEEEEKIEPVGLGIPRAPKPGPRRILDRMVAKPPYFLYGNAVSIPLDIWSKLSQFLYAIEPEFMGTQFFSALSRKEGYIHNLPTEGRSQIIPKPPLTLVDVLPHTKKWWPSWDTRKQLTSFSLGTGGVSQICDKYGRMLNESRGRISSELRSEILLHCEKLGLIWVGPYKLEPIGPEYLELILGYPLNHTQVDEISLKERLQSLSQCFQVDTLGHHLSVLKSMYPEGITLLSIFDGIGGAEITLHRLGIQLKAVVSVESSAMNRRILKNWWHHSQQTGHLEQIDDIHKLTSSRIEKLMEKFGYFDFIICQNSNCYTFKPYKSGQHEEFRPVFDFLLFHEFVRILQLVRNAVERQR